MNDTRDDRDSDLPVSGTTWGLAFALIALLAFSEHLAFNRIFQVDELQYVFTARLLATHQTAQYDASANLMLFGPMTWLAKIIDGGALLLRSERLLFFVCFWINLCLIVRCAGVRLRSQKGLFFLLLAATLAPLWDYGFEMRHENPLLAVLLLAWLFARPLDPDAKRRLFFVGFLVVIAQFLAFKAFAYAVPIAIGALVGAIWEEKRPVLRALLTLMAGAACATVACLLLHWFAGTWDIYFADTKSLGSTAVRTMRLSPIPALSRIVMQAPLLLVATAFAVVVALRNWRWRELVSRESLVPEVALLAVAVVVLLVNPTPYPYNLVLLVPQMMILCLRLDPQPFSRPVLIGLFALHIATWLVPTQRHLLMTNDRQVLLTKTAEQLTDPNAHAVLDGAGLVPTRHPPNRHWLIHGFTIKAFIDGTYPSIATQLAEGKTPVIIPNYRLGWLRREDHQFIDEHYMPLAGDFLVAGTAIPPGNEREWTCLVPGRYFLMFDDSTDALSLDNLSRPRGPVTIARGAHTFRNTSSQPAFVIWLGPTLSAPPPLPSGDPNLVFVNFY
ncbi:MAG: hypothetical protein JOZ54_16175 [Acidobacteria bacterium]|nr:hypothetical protein [Acidobacteriota bacterium]